MSRERFLHRRPAVALLVGCLAFAFVGHVASHESSTSQIPRIVFPPDRSVLLSGTFDVIADGLSGELKVDGKPLPWESTQPPVRVARVGLPPGWHELQVGDRRQNVVVALNEMEHDGPSDWQIVKAHAMGPPDNRCGVCHETRQADGQMTIGEMRGEACFECHNTSDFVKIHTHPLEPLVACDKCHAMHGSTREKLLRAPAKSLCEACHEPEP